MQLDRIDVTVAQQLCPGGVACYKAIDSGCTNKWIATNITPEISEVFGHALGVLFGKALLWLPF